MSRSSTTASPWRTSTRHWRQWQRGSTRRSTHRCIRHGSSLTGKHPAQRKRLVRLLRKQSRHPARGERCRKGPFKLYAKARHLPSESGMVGVPD